MFLVGVGGVGGELIEQIKHQKNTSQRRILKSVFVP